MSLKFFFNRKGAVVISLGILGWISGLYHLYTYLFHQTHNQILFFIWFGAATLILVIRFYPWYPKKDRGHGIELHFEKTLVPVTYMMVLTNILLCFNILVVPFLVFGIFLCFLILGVNAILLTFYFKDQDSIPPSYFVRNLHLK